MTTREFIRGTEYKGEAQMPICSEEYCKTLAKDFGIAETDVCEALEGEPMTTAIKICGWAEDVETSPLKRGQALSRWSKKNKTGVNRKTAV